MTPSPFVPLGRVVKAHGLKGEVSVAPAPGVSFEFEEAVHVWIVPPPAGTRSGRIEAVRPGPKGPLVKISGIDDIDAARRVVGSELLARAIDLPATWREPPQDDASAIGYRVRDDAHGMLGEIVDVIITGANDVWVVQGTHGELLIPVIDDVVLQIDQATESVYVRLLPGLLPEPYRSR